MVLPLTFIVMWLNAKERSEVSRCAMQMMQGGEMDAACHCGTVRFRVKLTDGFKTARRCTCSYCRMRGAVAVSADIGGISFQAGEEHGRSKPMDATDKIRRQFISGPLNDLCLNSHAARSGMLV